MHAFLKLDVFYYLKHFQESQQAETLSEHNYNYLINRKGKIPTTVVIE